MAFFPLFLSMVLYRVSVYRRTSRHRVLSSSSLLCGKKLRILPSTSQGSRSMLLSVNEMVRIPPISTLPPSIHMSSSISPKGQIGGNVHAVGNLRRYLYCSSTSSIQSKQVQDNCRKQCFTDAFIEELIQPSINPPVSMNNTIQHYE